MTARSSSAEMLRADEMRARILAHPEAWIALKRPRYRDYDPAEFTIVDDDLRLLLIERDPRAIELEYTRCRIEFWQAGFAGQVLRVARRAVVLARYLARRALDPERERIT